MQGTPKAIEIKGIVRNATVIGAQDGQAEDLINLRFMDGSWRASGDGRLVHTMSGTQYTQLYVHTNVYHHLLGVNNGTLYWFAEIGTDGVSFYPLDGTTSRTNWPQNMQSLPTAPVAITSVRGDLWIVQSGHMLTVIDGEDDFEHFVFKTDNKNYVEIDIDVNSKPTSRGINPFGQVHFNFFSARPDLLFSSHVAYLGGGEKRFSDSELDIKNHKYLSIKEWPTSADNDTRRDILKSLIGELRAENKFTGAVFVCAAVRLYDGSYAYASNPVLIYPRQQAHDKKTWFQKNGTSYDVKTFSQAPNYDTYAAGFPYQGKTIEDDGLLAYIQYGYDGDSDFIDSYHVNIYPYLQYLTIVKNNTVGISSQKFYDDVLPPMFYLQEQAGGLNQYFAALGYDLTFSIDDIETLKKNKDVFTHLCIFVTPDVDITNINNDEVSVLNDFLAPRDAEDVQYDLLHSPMFLLKEYKVEELGSVQANCIIDLTHKEDDGLLEHDNIVQRDRLPIEANMRTTYLPKVSYMYNGRLHIANYKSYPFFGYPIDLFHLHNHSVKVQSDSWFKGVLPNLTGNNDDYLQYTKTQRDFPSTIPSGCTYYAFIEVTIESSQGEQKVVRYIEPYEIGNGQNGRADFVESLNPLITYPDARAKKIKIVLYSYTGFGNYIGEFNLKPHPYLNIAYYIDPDLKPIKLSMGFSRPALPAMQNTEEYFPNGLKVSKTDNPMFFPVENAYQVGSAEILALMSNTIAVGTGQTGAAPLYVFCKDGVYALFVDASGQMTYSNSRVLARDVCNNPRSVTPIDAGVVFTTDRGLMMIAGEQVEEIGQPAEGDVLHYTNVNAQGQPLSVEGSKIATDALTKIAGLPSSLCDTTDFLTYLQDKGTLGKAAIVNYNHNMRELIISNPNYAYSYVLDREGNWSRRDYTAAQYVNNYPTSYRVTSGGQFYKVDDEGDANTSLEHRKEADNQIFYLSNVIKLDSIGFKQAYRFVVRGYFETIEEHTEPGYDIWQPIGSMGITPHNRYADNCLCYLTSDIYNSIEEGDNIRIVYAGSQSVMDEAVVTKKDNGPDKIEFSNNLNVFGTAGSYIFQKLIHIPPHEVGVGHLACVVEGSYDGRKFSPLGYNRKSGKFSNIGCNVEHTDVRFFRVILCGQVTGKTRIDYMELSANGSVLNTKIR